jgi:hypothetical protein
MTVQLEKSLRNKKSLEQELEKVRISFKHSERVILKLYLDFK